MIACPTCGDPLSTHGVCGSCGFGSKGKGRPKNDPEAAHWGELAAQAKRRSYESAPAELTDQQWYNVCKFFPWVAAHCKRPRFEVGSDHPLDATSKQGPLIRHLARRGDDPDAIEERAAIQAAGA